MNLIFTSRSLAACLQAADDDWFGSFETPINGEWNVLATDSSGSRFIFHRDDQANAQRIVLIANASSTALHGLPHAARRHALERIHRAALSAASPPPWLPPDWSPFHDNNLIAFFATNREHGNLRWIMENVAGDTHDICLWELTSADRQVLLHQFNTRPALLSAILREWSSHLTAIQERFAKLPLPQGTATIEDSVELAAASFGAVTRYQTYSAWLKNLSGDQLAFVTDTARTSIKLRGPAGSGKTLALELRLLRELYNARKQGRDIRILFATHSWQAATQVESALRQLDESGDIRNVDVMPLLVIAQETIPAERTARGLRLLGEDSLSGKKAQLELLTSLIQRIRTADWLAYRGRVSEDFRRRVESTDVGVQNALVWDLTNEFASVLSANGILPGINAERRYLAIQRLPWMMPLDNDAEKQFVLHVYDRYVSSLKTDGLLASDQLINDFWNYLETFAWNIRRETVGYDVIFVDELHLFSEQERLALGALTRSPNEYARMYMALDPRQAPTDVFAGFGSAIRRVDSGQADEDLGTIRALDLRKIYRFSPQILDLVRHINRSYPSIDSLGPDWVLDLNEATSETATGPVPDVGRYRDSSSEAAAVATDAAALLKGVGTGRVAIVLLDPLLIPAYEQALRAESVPLTVITSREDVDRMRYVRRTAILSAAEYVGGLQFDTVLCAGLIDTFPGVAHSGHHRRRFISLLYLALTRATRRISIYVNDTAGGIPEVLATALANGLLLPRQSAD